MISIRNSSTDEHVSTTRLAVKILLASLLVGLFAALLISGFYYFRLQRVEMHNNVQSLGADAIRVEKQLKDIFIRIERHMMALALSDPMHALVNADDIQGPAAAEARDELQIRFASILRANPFYEQVRFIAFDSTGSEIVRVDRMGGDVAATPPDALQAKSGEPYFGIARQLPSNEIHFTRITLNREHGRISDPPTPMLRVLVNLTDDHDTRVGFLVFNVNFARVFAAALETLQADRKLYVVNQDGDYLIHPDKGREFGFEYGKQFRIGDEFPPAAGFMASSRDAALVDLTRAPEGLGLALRKLFFAPYAPEHFWGVGVGATRDVLLRDFHRKQRESWGYILLAILATAVLSGILTLLTTRPLQRREAEMADQKQFLDLIIANIPDIIFIKDSDLRIVSANDAFLSLYPPDRRDKVIGATTLEEFHPAQAEEFTREDRDALEKGYTQAYETIDFPDGTRRTLFTKKVGFTDHHGRRLLLGVSRDITELKDVEEQLLAANADLERFAFIASHDLQEPLRMITNFNGLLAEEYGDKLDDDARMYIEFSVEAAKRMQRLITNLLEYSRLQQEQGGSTRVDTSQVLDGVLDNLKTLIAEYEAEITFDALPAVYCNPMQLTRVFQNLISNAIKYRDADRAPQIHIGVRHETDRFVFSVADNGIGIEEKYHKQIFQLFKRLHTYDKLPGTGIGLSICKKIVYGWDGDIWVESTPGEGSVFYFTIPDLSPDA